MVGGTRSFVGDPMSGPLVTVCPLPLEIEGAAEGGTSVWVVGDSLIMSVVTTCCCWLGEVVCGFGEAGVRGAMGILLRRLMRKRSAGLTKRGDFMGDFAGFC